MAELSSMARPQRSCKIPATKPRGNSSQPCRDFLARPGRQRNNDSLLPPPTGTRLPAGNRCLHSCLFLHDTRTWQLLRRDATEPADFTGNSRSLAHPVSTRPAAAHSLRLLGEFCSPRPDGVFVCLQQSSRAAPVGALEKYSAVDNHRNIASLGDCHPARSLECGTPRPFTGSRDLLEHRRAFGRARSCVGARSPRACRKNSLVPDRRHGPPPSCTPLPIY